MVLTRLLPRPFRLLPLTGKDGAFGPLLKEFLEAALDGEMSSHLDDSERLKGNKRNGRGSKRNALSRIC